MGIGYCAGGMVCFAALYILVGHSQKRKADPHGLTLLVFLTGLAMSLVRADAFAAELYPGRLVLIGTLIGVAAGVGIFGTSLSAHAGVPTSIVNTVASLALTVPIVLALVLFHQMPRAAQWLGLGLAVTAILLLQGVRPAGGTEAGAGASAGRQALRAVYMTLMFLGNGLAQFLQARLHHEGLGGFQAQALTLMYLAGAVCSAGALAVFRGRINGGALRYGCGVGMASFFGNFCVLHALATLPASVVFPVAICGPIVLTVIFSRVVEGDRLSARQGWGLASGAAALLMLTVG